MTHYQWFVVIEVALVFAFSGYWILQRRSLKKKVEARKPRVWVIKDPELCEELWGYWTKWDSDDDFVARYRFWRKIREICPETEEAECQFDVSVVGSVVITELIQMGMTPREKTV